MATQKHSSCVTAPAAVSVPQVSCQLLQWWIAPLMDVVWPYVVRKKSYRDLIPDLKDLEVVLETQADREGRAADRKEFMTRGEVTHVSFKCGATCLLR